MNVVQKLKGKQRGIYIALCRSEYTVEELAMMFDTTKDYIYYVINRLSKLTKVEKRCIDLLNPLLVAYTIEEI